jgi:hypothetical protein
MRSPIIMAAIIPDAYVLHKQLPPSFQHSPPSIESRLLDARPAAVVVNCGGEL